MTDAPRKYTIQELAEFTDKFVKQTRLRDGATAIALATHFDVEDIQKLHQVDACIKLFRDYETDIKAVLMAKKEAKANVPSEA